MEPVGAPITIPALPIPEVSLLDAVFRAPIVKAFLPIPVILAVAPLVYWFFKDTWRELDREALEARALRTSPDYQSHVALVLLAITLTIHEYYGGRAFFNDAIYPYIVRLEQAGLSWIQSQKFAELYGYGYWVSVRLLGYMVVPILLWKVLFPKEKVLDMGLRSAGFFSHLGLYALSLGVVFLAMLVVGRQADFAAYYPFYHHASRSWFDLLLWEGIYFAQFFGLEFFFRGFLLHAFRLSMGSSAIFAMAVPYCMIHFGKPYLETHGAIIAGVVLGSLAMRTRSIYAGFLVHIAVAGAMDFMALSGRSGLPKAFWP